MASKTCLFLGSIPYELSKEQLEEVFQDFDVLSIRVPLNDQQKPKGIAFVDFASSEQAAKAFEFAQGVELMGRRLKVDYSDKPNPNRSFQSDGGSRDSGSRDSGSRDSGPSWKPKRNDDESPSFKLKQRDTSVIKPPEYPKFNQSSGFSMDTPSKTSGSSQFKVGDTCEAKYSVDGVWYQARIDDIVEEFGSTKFLVTYTEFGNSEELEQSSLRSFGASSSQSTSSPSPSSFSASSSFGNLNSKPTFDQQSFNFTPTKSFETNDFSAQKISATPFIDSAVSSFWKVGDICEGKFSEDGVWYLCSIEKIVEDGKLYQVKYSEYGNTETLSLISLREVQPPPNESLQTQTKTTESKPKIENESSSLSPHNHESKWKIGDECQALIDQKWVDVIIDDASIKSNWFLVINSKNSKQLTEPKIVQFSDLRSPPAVIYAWKVGDVCQGQYFGDDQWYEVVIFKIAEDGCWVTYTDFGNSEKLPRTRLRPNPESQPPPLASSAPKSNGLSNHESSSNKSEILTSATSKIKQIQLSNIPEYTPKSSRFD